MKLILTALSLVLLALAAACGGGTGSIDFPIATVTAQ